MPKIRVWFWATICLLAATSIASAQSSLVALKIIPANADGFAVIAKISDLDKKIAALAQKANAPVASVFDLAKKFAGIDDGINRDGSAVVIIFAPQFDRPPVAVVALPVSNFEAVAKSVNAKDAVAGVHEFQIAGMDAVMAKKGNFALVAQTEHKESLVATLKSEQSILEKTKSFERWLASQDVAVVVLDTMVRALAKKVTENLPEDIPGLPDEQAKAIKEQFEWMRGFAKSASQELTHFAVGATVDAEQNTKFALHAGFVNGGSFSKWGVNQPKESPLAGLPSGAYIMAFGSTYSPESMQKLMTLNAQFSKTAYDLSDAEAKELGTIWANSVRGMQSAAFGFLPPTAAGASMFDGLVGVIRVDSAKDYLKSSREAVERSNKILKIESTSKAVKVGKFDGYEMIADLKSMLKQNKDPNAEKLLKKMFGSGDKLTTTVVAVNANTILMSYAPADKMKALADSYAERPMLSAAPLVAKTLKLFPEKSFMVSLINPKGMIEFVDKMAKEMGAELPIPPFGETAPVGFAANSDAISFQFHVAVPGSVITEIGKLVQKHQSSLKGRRQELLRELDRHE